MQHASGILAHVWTTGWDWLGTWAAWRVRRRRRRLFEYVELVEIYILARAGRALCSFVFGAEVPVCLPVAGEKLGLRSDWPIHSRADFTCTVLLRCTAAAAPAGCAFENLCLIGIQSRRSVHLLPSTQLLVAHSRSDCHSIHCHRHPNCHRQISGPTHTTLAPISESTLSPVMGRYNFAPQRVHQAATRLLETKRLSAPPPWYDVIANLPPSQRLVRPALQGSRNKGKKASKLFQPVKIEYQEDSLRAEFFGDHPWELARPRQVLEDDGKDYQKFDWSRLEQSSKQLDGERYASVIEHCHF